MKARIPDSRKGSPKQRLLDQPKAYFQASPQDTRSKWTDRFNQIATLANCILLAVVLIFLLMSVVAMSNGHKIGRQLAELEQMKPPTTDAEGAKESTASTDTSALILCQHGDTFEDLDEYTEYLLENGYGYPCSYRYIQAEVDFKEKPNE